MTDANEIQNNRRILIVSPAKPSKGGIASYIEDLFLSELKDEFHLKLYDCHAVKNRFKKEKSHIDFKEVIDGGKVIRLFLRHMKDFDPAVVHIHTSSYWGFYEKAALVFITKYFFKRKVILHIHGGDFYKFYKKSILKVFIRYVLWCADKSLIVSKQIKEAMKMSNLHVVDNSTRFDNDWMYINKSQKKIMNGINPEKTVFLALTLLVKEKGIYEIFEVIRSVLSERNDFVFIVAGDGPEKEMLVEHVKENGLNDYIKIMDFVSGIKKKELLNLSDVFILNSSCESFGISLIEAVGNGLFVITTPVGIASYCENVFNNKNCIRVPIGDKLALKNAIMTVLEKKIAIEDVNKLNYLEFKSRFDVGPVFGKMKLIYKEVLNSNYGS